MATVPTIFHELTHDQAHGPRSGKLAYYELSWLHKPFLDGTRVPLRTHPGVWFVRIFTKFGNVAGILPPHWIFFFYVYFNLLLISFPVSMVKSASFYVDSTFSSLYTFFFKPQSIPVFTIWLLIFVFCTIFYSYSFNLIILRIFFIN